MRGFYIPLVFILILLISVIVFGARSNSQSSDSDHEVASSSPSASPSPPLPLKSKHEEAIVAAPDGTIYLMEKNSGTILWSFASGPSIYSYHQALPHHEGEMQNASKEDNNFYLEVGEDWKLYVHGNGFEKVKLPMSVEELIRRTPLTLAGDGVMLGSKKSTVFILDVKSGKEIQTFTSDNFTSSEDQHNDENPILPRMDDVDWSNTSRENLNKVDGPLYLTRRDYALKFSSLKTGKVIWYLTLAEFEASFKCDGIENFLGGALYQVNDFGPTKGLQVHCPSRLDVYRIRDRSSLESIFVRNALPGDRVLSLPAADPNPTLEPVDKIFDFLTSKEAKVTLALPSPENQGFGIMPLPLPTGEFGQTNTKKYSEIVAGSHFWTSVLFSGIVLFLVVLFSFLRSLLNKKSDKTKMISEEFPTQAVTSKRKKNRKPGTSRKSSIVDKKQSEVSSYQISGISNVKSDFKSSKMYWQPVVKSSGDLTDGRKVGRLFVSTKEIAKGSNGTIVLEGIYDGRPVAVKRLVRTHHDVAIKEIQNLIASDQHPNIVRWHGVEYDQDFVYLALERCTCSLHEFVLFYTNSTHNKTTSQDGSLNSSGERSVPLQIMVGDNNEIELWKSNGYPSSHMLKLMRDVVHGLAHLHELGIIHRDLKPQNVLIMRERSLCGKLSDMGISKQLAGDMTALTKNSTGSGSSGWQAPEQLRNERQTRAVDLFSLGCLLFFCITGGQHPFGETFERDTNIVHDRKDLFLIENLPEATDLVTSLLHPKPEFRPKAMQVSCHPLFWNSEMRLSFLRDVSDRVELEDRENDSELLKTLENTGNVAFGGKWDEKMDSAFLGDIGRYRRYKFDSVRDLLRVVRNKLNHYRELSKEIQGILGPVPDGFDNYFSMRFPRLLIEVYKVIQLYCKEEETFQKYFKQSYLA